MWVLSRIGRYSPYWGVDSAPFPINNGCVGKTSTERVQKWRQENPERAAAHRIGEYSRLSPEAKKKAKARAKLGVYVRRGKVVKPDACEICGFPGLLHGHHHKGYEPDVALDVVWLCEPCHGSVHK